MAKEKRTRKIYTEEQQRAILDALDMDKMPSLPGAGITTESIVRSSYDKIQKLREAGYSYELICKQIVQCGLDIKPATLKNYIYKIGSEQKANASGEDGKLPGFTSRYSNSDVHGAF